jgi:TonB-dependent SusC/RagA subfamily outer membrane receptor
MPRRFFAPLGAALLLAAAACAPALREPPACDVADASCADTGYGLRPRRTMTGATSTYVPQPADADGFGRIEQLLEGRVPGVAVTRLATGDYTVSIRGGMAQNNRGDALIVVDGIPTPAGIPASRALGTISPGTVVRIDVLKDIGATSAYGARGVNGVILITTRR